MSYSYDLVNKTHYESKELVGYPFTWQNYKMTFASALLDAEYSESEILRMGLELEINGPVDLEQAAPLLQAFELDLVKLKQQFQTAETTGTLYLQSKTQALPEITKKQVLSSFLDANPTIDLTHFEITKWEAGVPLG